MGLDYFSLIFASTNNPYIYDRTTVTAKDRVAYVCRQANHYSGRYANSYFWRTTQQQEIDYIEECDGQFTVFEMKWNPRRANTQFPSSFLLRMTLRRQLLLLQTIGWNGWFDVY